jgi:carboxyl-terminal processing protease
MTKNKKNTSMVAVLALFVALACNVHAQTTTQPAQPATPTVTQSPTNPEDFIRLMFGPVIQIQTGPSQEDLEGLYHTVWQRIGARYYKPEALVKSDWGKWEHAYDGKLITEADLDSALKAMVGSLADPWTKYTSRADMKAAVSKDSQDIVSLGINTRINPDSAVVISFLDFGSPAYNSALRTGDVLKAVDGKPLTGMTAEAIDELLTGKVGKEMAITYVRDNADATIKLVFAKHFEGNSEATVLPGKVLYLRLPAFSQSAYTAFEKAVNELKNKPGFEDSFSNIVLDLRGNPGGDVDLAIHMVETFLSDGVAFHQEQRNGRIIDITTKRIRPFLPFQGKDGSDVSVCQTALLHGKPLAILVNGSSASSAEIVTAALSGNKRATVVGTRTFGKAVAWTGQRLPNGGFLSITISGLKAPDGESWHGTGLKPTVEVEQPRDATVDYQLLKAIEVLTKGK